MKTAQTIGKAAALALLVFTVLVTACQSTGGNQSTSGSQRNSEDLNNALSYRDRGTENLEKGNINQALTDLNRAIQLDPNDFFSYYERARVYSHKQDYSRALADVNQSLRLNPDFAQAWGMRSMMNGMLGNLQEAINDATKAISFYSNAEDLGPDLYWLRGLCYFQIGDYDKALADVETMLKLDPGDEDALRLRGEIRAARATQ